MQRQSFTVPIEPLEPRALLAAQLVADLNPTTPWTLPRGITALGDHAFFYRPDSGLWETDGTVAGSHFVAPLLGTPTTNPAAFPGAGLVVYGTSVSQWGVVRSDGTEAGTFFLTRDVPSQPQNFYPVGPTLFWFGIDITVNLRYDLWKSDGTAEGTRRVTGVGQGAGDVVGLHGKAYFRTPRPGKADMNCGPATAPPRARRAWPTCSRGRRARRPRTSPSSATRFT